MLSVPPAAANESELFDTEYVQADCVTVNVLSAMVIVALRVAPAFCANVYMTVPLPVPDEPAVIVNQVALLVAVHAQNGVVVTERVADPDAAETAADGGVSVYWQSLPAVVPAN